VTTTLAGKTRVRISGPAAPAAAAGTEDGGAPDDYPLSFDAGNHTGVFKPGGSGFVTHDGSLGMKWGWWRGVRGQLRIKGHRLEMPGLPLRAYIPKDGYGDNNWTPV
jgi:hypothetical protein